MFFIVIQAAVMVTDEAGFPTVRTTMTTFWDSFHFRLEVTLEIDEAVGKGSRHPARRLYASDSAWIRVRVYPITVPLGRGTQQEKWMLT